MSVTSQKQPLFLRLSDIRVDAKKLFLKLSETAVRIGIASHTGDWKSALAAIGSAFGAAEAISVKPDPEALAWHLIRGGLARGISELVAEASPSGRIAAGDQDQLDRQIEAAIDGGNTVEIDLDFFDNPTRLHVLAAFSQILQGWLRFCDLDEVQARAVATRLPSYFAVGLHDEWRAGERNYEPLLASLSGPLAKAARFERDWQSYRQSLIKQFDRPVFEERFALSAIYVPLRATYHETLRKISDPRSGSLGNSFGSGIATQERARSVVVDLESELGKWLAAGDPHDAIRIIRGGPGSGKSTSARKLAADMAGANVLRTLFFPLQHFRMSGKLIDAIGEALGEHGAQAFHENPLLQPGFATQARPLLLIFDGLDELVQPGPDADKQTRDFLVELRFLVDGWNANHSRVFCLLTGRSAIIQAHRDVLRRKDVQELEVLPLFVPQAIRDRREAAGIPFFDAQSLLDRDQRDDWWQRYTECNAREPLEIPTVLKNEDVSDLSSEPLLLYLLVLSGHHRLPASADQVNRNEIYARLFSDVADRRHAGGLPLSARSELQQDFAELMETIATAAWYGDGRIATVADIRRVCPRHLTAALEQFVGNEAGVARLIAAFYFQQAEGSSRQRTAIEFTHKSFGEYLTARRLVRAIDEIHHAIIGRHRRYDEMAALTEWGELTSHTAMDVDLLRFVRDEVALHAPEAKDWCDTLTGLFNLCLRDGMPIGEEAATPRLSEQRRRNAEEALLVVLNACARVSGQIVAPEWGGPTGAGDLLHRLRRQRPLAEGDGPPQSVALRCLSHMDFRDQILFGQDLFFADMTHSDLRGVMLVASCGARGQFRSAKFSGAIFEASIFVEANFDAADLTEASLRDARFDDASFRGAIFVGAKCESANLERADLQGADVENASFRKARMRGVDLGAAKNVESALLEGAELDNPDFGQADTRLKPEKAGLPENELTE